MKYYKIDIRSFYPNDRIATRANGEKIKNANSIFYKIKNGEILEDAPIFDYFFLQSYDEKKYWEWQLNDVHRFIGEGSQIPGWLISKELKLLLETFRLTQPYHFYQSKLLYQKKKLDYYIFQFTGGEIFKKTLLNLNLPETIFYDPIKEKDIAINNIDEFIFKYKEIYKENKNINYKMRNKKLTIYRLIDFFPIGTFLKEDLVSERLKVAIEEKGITGFEFSELDYEVEVPRLASFAMPHGTQSNL